MPSAVVRMRVSGSASAIARYGSQIDQASMLPFLKAAAASAGLRSTPSISSGASPTLRSAFTVTLWALEPRLKATFLPFRSSSDLIGESFLTRIAEPAGLPR